MFFLRPTGDPQSGRARRSLMIVCHKADVSIVGSAGRSSREPNWEGGGPLQRCPISTGRKRWISCKLFKGEGNACVEARERTGLPLKVRKRV